MKQFNSDGLSVGDELTRMIGSTLPMTVVVGKIDEQFIYCGSKDGVIDWETGWKFRKDNGAEVDEKEGWSGNDIFSTGSFLIRKNKKQKV